MELLQTIFSSPTQLFEKAKRDGDSLVEALKDCDEQEVRDALFNFAITAYHICDWIKTYRPDMQELVTALLNDCEAIAACCDLCNASKHLKLSLDDGPYKKHPPVIEDVNISSITSPPISEEADPTSLFESQLSEQTNLPTWRLKIHLVSGRCIRAEDHVVEVLDVWNRFFDQNAIF